MTKDYSEILPDRNGTDIPPQVQWFLSLCELSTVWHEHLEENIDTEQDKFCEGVVDYWWDYEVLEEPTLDMLARANPLSTNRVAYQKGAITGYKLAEEFKDG